MLLELGDFLKCLRGLQRHHVTNYLIYNRSGSLDNPSYKFSIQRIDNYILAIPNCFIVL